MNDNPPDGVIPVLLKSLRMPTMTSSYETLARQAEDQGWSHEEYLRHLLELEVAERRERRLARHLEASRLPADKTLASLERKRLPIKVARVLPSLCDGGFVRRAENVLAFGNPGTGKSHVVAAIGHELIRLDLRVLFVPCFRLVQQLLSAKRDLKLDAMLKRLDRFDVVILDDIGYVQQEREEMEVLFTFLSERYERRSVVITSNLVFSAWDRIFKDAMTTAAAIDRVVHHATILELTGKSYRSDAAKRRKQGDEGE